MSKSVEPFIDDILFFSPEEQLFLPKAKMDEPSISTHSILFQQRTTTGVMCNSTNPCSAELVTLLKQNGKIPYSQFIEICLFGRHGYYSQGAVTIGDVAQGNDFITSSEASSFFGHAIGMLAKKTWEALNKPKKFTILELGAGNGGMAEGLLQWAKLQRPDFYQTLNYHIVETGKALIERQQKRLSSFGNIVQWTHASILDIDLSPITGFIVFNELMDAFPVERVAKINGKIRQKFVTLDEKQWVETWDVPTQQVVDYLTYVHKHLNYVFPSQNSIEEPINIPALNLQQKLDQLLIRGTILNIDYGAFGAVGIKNAPAAGYFSEQINSRWAIYETPGFIDITSQVNFFPLAKQAEKDGLRIEFRGIQSHLLAQTGLYKQLAKKIRSIKNLKSWDEFASFSHNLQGLFNLAHPEGGGNYYCLLTTKGLPKNSSLLDSPSPFPDFPVVKIQTGTPSIEVTCRIEKDRFSLLADSKGYITLLPLHADSITFTFPTNKKKMIPLKQLGKVFFLKKPTFFEKLFG